jgi:hypothetical protein
MMKLADSPSKQMPVAAPPHAAAAIYTTGQNEHHRAVLTARASRLKAKEAARQWDFLAAG